MTRKQLPFFVAFFVLMFGGLACTCLGSGIPIGGIQATANAALTQAARGAATAGAQGNSLQATANAVATSALATANAANSGSTGGEPTATKATAGQPTAVATVAASAAPTDSGTGGNTTGGGPSDIPIVAGQNTVLFSSDKLVSYTTKTDLAAVVKFYKDSMPKNGWTLVPAASVETPTATILEYTKDNRTASLTMGKDPSSGLTLVAIAIQ